MKPKPIERARAVIPGGVNSPVRAFGAVGGDPIFIDHGAGPLIFDVDGRSYIDHVLSWGAILLGHAPVEVVRQVKEAAERGLSFGAPTEAETELAEILCAALPSLERVRLVSSGTEATMSALRLARGFTGRPLIMKFEGHYHGHSDALLVDAGSGALTFAHPSSAGVTQETAAQTVVAPFNRPEAVEKLFRTHGDQLAAVIVEPVAGNMNLVLPDTGFLHCLHELCVRYGTLLIFDEVMTGFRVGWAGAQGIFNIKPDLTTLGKVVGGGLPLAAFGGRADVMEQLAPLGAVYQAGTLSGNPLAVAAGIKTLHMAKTPGLYGALSAYSQALCAGLAEAAKAVGVPFCAQAQGGMFGIYFRSTVPQTYAEAMDCDRQAFKKFFHAMLQRGVYLAPSPFETGFVSSAHGHGELQSVIQAARESFVQIQNS